jgi:integrase/recombinase XerD
MSASEVYLRVIRARDSQHHFAKAVWINKSRIRPHYAVVDGKPEHHPEGTYYLRYRLAGKRVWSQIGSDPSLVFDRWREKNNELDAIAIGREPLPVETKKPVKRSLADAATEYLLETTAHKSKKTLDAYTITLDRFQEFCRKEYLEDIDRKDMLAFITFLKGAPHKNAPRTVRNRVDAFQYFLHHYKLPSILLGKDLPTYTKKRARAYSEADLGKLFGEADQEESERLHFLLCTGTREQEMEYACWPDLNLASNPSYTVTEHLDLGFKPKDKEEGTIPIPEYLAEMLRERRRRYPTARLVFPTAAGKPDGHLLRMVKDLGLRSGLNCGFCINKAGESCADTPTCKHVILHKLRKTYASMLSKKGIPPRTIMRYLRHSDLATTLAYLDDQDDDHTRAVVDSAFSGIGSADSTPTATHTEVTGTGGKL